MANQLSSKSKIPVPASLYLNSTRSSYLTELSDQVFIDEEDSKDFFSKRPSTSIQYGYGPPGILHETSEKYRRRHGSKGKSRRPSSEFGDSSIELLGPSESLDIEDDDSTDEFLSETIRNGEGSGERSGRSATFQRFEERRGGSEWHKRRSHTVAEDTRHTFDQRRETHDENNPRERDRSEYLSKPRKKSATSTWTREQGRSLSRAEARPSDDSRTPSRSPIRTPVRDVSEYESSRSPSKTPVRDIPEKQPTKLPSRVQARDISGKPTGKKPTKTPDRDTPDRQPSKSPSRTPTRDASDKPPRKPSASRSPARDVSQKQPTKPSASRVPARDISTKNPKKPSSKSPVRDTPERESSKSPARTPADTADKKIAKSPAKSPGKSPSRPSSKTPASAQRFPPKDVAATADKIEKWKKDAEEKEYKKEPVPPVDIKPKERKEKKLPKPGVSPTKDIDDGKWRVDAPVPAKSKGKTTGGNRVDDDEKIPKERKAVDKKDGKEKPKDGDKKDGKDKPKDEKKVDWDMEANKVDEDEWKISSKPPAMPRRKEVSGDPVKMEEKLKEDEVRDTAAGMRVLQLCQTGDWYGVDGHLKYLEKRVQLGNAASTRPLATVKDDGGGWTPLMYAVKNNQIPVADRLLDLGCDINAKTKDGLAAAHMAVLYGRDDTVRFLIFRKVDVSVITDKKNQNLLHIACSRTGNNASILRALLAVMSKDARLQKDSEGNIPIFVALRNGLRSACQELLSKQATEQLAQRSGDEEDSPLHLAVRKKDMEIARIFVDSGAEVDAVNKLGQTPLHLAAESGDENLVKFFFLCKANPHLADNEDRTAIHLAAMNGHTELIDILADKFKVSVFERTRDGSTLMHIASLHGHPETAMALFRKGVPLQMPNKGGARSIHIAARHGHSGMINKLLEKGEKVDASTNDNFTALHIAVEAVRPQVVETLLGYGAQVHIKGGKDKETPLHIAARVNGGEKCALMLLKSGADPNITMENGETPLHVASRHGRLKIIRLLLQDGGNPQQRGKDGDTPLHLACRYGHILVVQQLLEHVKRTKSANECTLYINSVTVKGESSLHYAARLNPRKINLQESEANLNINDIGQNIVKLLLDGGASVSRQTKDNNETAFHYCAKEGNNDILLEMLSRLTPVECQRALNRQSSKGWSPLLIACRRGHTEVVKTLLEYHARVDVFDNDGRSGLHLGAESGFQEICGILLEHKAFINAKSRVGLTALHLAATKGFSKLCLFLIREHGASVDALTLKKQTPLHLAAENGQLEVSRLLMGLRASPDATDDKGQKPIHLAAQNNHAEVIKLFLKHSKELVSSFTKDGSTCAHLAAMQGSVAVLEELMKFDIQGVISARNRSTDATALQLAAEGGHADLVKALLSAGASASDENRSGYTAAHLAAKNGHTNVLEALRKTQVDSINLTSRKLGVSALHIAAFYGQTETIRELLQYIPATSATDPPLSPATAFLKELGNESGLTSLHMASYSGEENVVRLLLNFEGVQADAPTTNFGFNPLHLACRGGHSTVVGLLLSRSSELLESKDASGKSSLHIAAVNGHKQMVEVLLGQGAEIDAIDKELWTPLICAAKAGHLDVVRLFMDSGASPLAKTSKGQSAIWFAAAENHVDVLSYLMKKDHDTYGLLEDKDFVYNLCVCGKNIDNEPIDEFVLSSPAPVDVAAKMSHFLVYVSSKEKERAKDLISASKHCEAMATELLALAAGAETAGKVLEAVDRKGTEFLDVLIDKEQKEVIAHTVVQRHLQEIWVGHLDWADWKLLLMFFSFVFVPPIWITFSVPFGPKYNKIPIIKFMSYLTSHIHLMILLCLTCVTPIHPVFPIRTNLLPFWFEWMLFAWLGGLLVAEMTNPSDKSGLGWIKVAVLAFCYLGNVMHLCSFFIPVEDLGTALYLRDQLFGVGILCACVQILDFLSFHYLFGPWAIIIGNLMKDLARFLAVLMIFMVGFSLVMAALNHPIHPRKEKPPGMTLPKTLTDGLPSGVLVTPLDAFELLFFALFGLNGAGDLKIEILGQPDWTLILFKVFFGVYLLVTVIVLINLLIAMMSDTYQRIEAQSDIEWKFGLAKLIRSMHRTTATPSPLNLFVDWGTWIYKRCKKARETKNPLKWEQSESEVEKPKAAFFAATKEKVPPKVRWQQFIKKTQMTPKVSDMMQISAIQVNQLAGNGSQSQLGSTLSGHGGAQRIEMVTDWHIIAKKYRLLVGKEEPVEEPDAGDDQGSRNGASSHMGSSMMLI